MLQDIPPEDIIRIIMSRHADSEGNFDDDEYAITGDPFISLTKIGRKRAYSAGRGLANYYKNNRLKNKDGSDITAQPVIFTSTYQRCRETLEQFLISLNDENIFTSLSDVYPEDRLIEQSFGLMSHLNIEKRKSRFLKKWILKKFITLSKDLYQKNPTLTSTLLGESKMDVYMRADSFINHTLMNDIKEGKRDFFISGHGGINNAIIARWFHIPLDQWENLPRINNCDAIEIIGTHKNWQVRRIWDGIKNAPTNDNPLEIIDFITRENLTRVPKKLRL